MAKRHETQRGVTHEQDDSRSSKDKEAAITMKPRVDVGLRREDDGRTCRSGVASKEAKSSVSERVDIDTTWHHSGPCYVTRYGNERDNVIVTTSTIRSTR